MNNNVISIHIQRYHDCPLLPKVLQGVSEEIIRMATPDEDLNVARVSYIVYVHCREEGCIGKYIPRGPRDFPRAGILHPEAREISRGRSPREISRAEGCKIPARGKSQGPRGMYFPMHPDSRQCTSILSALAGKY